MAVTRFERVPDQADLIETVTTSLVRDVLGRPVETRSSDGTVTSVVAALGIERWGQRAGELARVLGKHPDVVSRWARIAAMRRADEPELARRHDELDHALAQV